HIGSRARCRSKHGMEFLLSVLSERREGKSNPLVKGISGQFTKCLIQASYTFGKSRFIAQLLFEPG
ncbi:MAG: hypothetical protein ACYC64_20330, partial [Armatimonadota bacterium]